MIKESAIKFPSGKIYTGKRHCDCFKVAAAAGEAHRASKVREEIQGFVTDKGKFLTREKAAEHAIACGQIKKLKYCTKRLFSEDLW